MIISRGLPWLRRTFESGGLVLTYHRVTEWDWNPFNTCITPKHFAEHLEVLRKFGRPATAEALFDASVADRHLRSGVAVTFDDGYRDNLETAKPLLERYDVPATIYVCSGPLLARTPYYWDEAYAILLSTESRPAEVAAGSRSWTVPADLPGRREVYLEFCAELTRLPAEQREKALIELRCSSGHGSEVEKTELLLSTAEIAALESDSIITIQAHTINHSWLPSETPDEQLRQLRQSRLDLEAVVGRRVSDVAYPYGQYDAFSLAAVAEAGFKRAYTTYPSRIGWRTDPFQIPRLVVPDVDGDTFEHMLREVAFGLSGRRGISWGMKRALRKSLRGIQAEGNHH